MRFYSYLGGGVNCNLWGQDTIAQPYEILDRFGNRYDIGDIEAPHSLSGIMRCNPDVVPECASFSFQTDYYPPFDGPDYAEMRNVICQVLRDLSCSIIASPDPCTELPPTVRIKVDAVTTAGVLGAASSYYYNYSNNAETMTSYAHGNVWRVINGGMNHLPLPTIISTDPNTNLYHGFMRFNPNFNWNFNMVDTTFANNGTSNSYDMYQVVLHEVVHMLGIASWISANGSSLVSPAATAPFGLYTRFDRYLQEHASGNPLLTNTDDCYDIDFTGNATLITGGCDQIDFQAADFSTTNMYIYTPSSWEQGSSMSHFGNDACTTNAYLMHASIHNNTAGHAIRRPTNGEWHALCEIGYELSASYGDGAFPFHTNQNGVPIPNCGQQHAGNDDLGPACNQEYILNCDFPYVISIADILANDVNVLPNIDCVETVVGNVTFNPVDATSTEIVITDAQPGLNVLAYIPTGTNGEPANMTLIYLQSRLCCQESADTCNVVINPEIILPATCPVNNTGDYVNILNACPEFSNEGWSNAFGTSNYFNASPYPGGPSPLSGTMLGFRTHPQPSGTTALNGEGISAGVNIEPDKRYIGSIVKALEPEHPSGNRPNLEWFYVDLTNDLVPQVVQTFNTPIDALNVYTETNVTLQQWHQAFFCIEPLDTAYCNALIYGNNLTYTGGINGVQNNSYTMIDRLDIMPDIFPPDTTLIDTASVCCVKFLLGDTLCQTLPNLSYAWESLDATQTPNAWLPIDTVHTPYYEVERCDTGCVWFRLLRGIHTTAALPVLGNTWQCIADTAYFRICVSNADTTITDDYDLNCCLAIADSTYTYFDPAGNLVAIDHPAATPHYTATAADLDWTPSSHPLGAAAGTAADPIYINGTITIPTGIIITMTGLHINFGPHGRVQVRANGRLTADNCRLDGLPQCQTMWQGIQAEGLSLSNVGRVYLRNGTRLRHAIIGTANMLMPLFQFADIQAITLSDPTMMLNPLTTLLPQPWQPTAMNSAGGLIDILDSQVQDCFTGAMVAWRSFPNSACSFQQSLFDYSGSQWYPFNELQARPEMGIFGLRVHEVGTVLYNEFRQLKYGVRCASVDAFKPVGNEFRQCHIGIAVSQPSYNALHATSILENTFFNCIIGLQTNGSDQTVVADNEVNPGTLSAGPLPKSIGFYFRGSNFDAHNNHINRTGFGVVLTDNDADGSFVGGNVINQTAFGITAQGDNTGVEIKCNHLIAYQKRGIDIRQYATTAENGDLGQQGLCDIDDPAANTFLPATGAFDLFFDDHSNILIYEDVVATALTKGYGTIDLGDCVCTDCDNIDVVVFCDMLGLTPISEIGGIGDEVRKNRELSKWLYAYISEGDYTAAYQLLHDYQSSATRRRLIDQKIVEGKLDSAQWLLDQQALQSEEQVRFREYEQLQIDLAADGRDWTNLNPAEIAQLNTIALSRTKTAFKAQTALMVARGQQFESPLPDDGDGMAWHTVFKADDDTADGTIGDFMPNPADDIAQFNYRLLDGSTAELVVYDYTGRTIERTQLTGSGNYTLDMGRYTAGIYLYSVVADDNELKSGKLIIIK